MEFILKTSIAKDYFKILSQTLSNFTYKPELEGILVLVYKDKLEFIVRNDYIDLKIVEKDPNNFSISKIGRILIKGKFINEIIQRFSNQNINFFAQNNQLTIADNESKYTIATINSENYEIPNFEISTIKKLSLEVGQLKKMINKMLFSADEKSTRRILQGISFNYKNNELTLISTDTIKASITKSILTINNEEEAFEKVIHIKTFKEILKSFLQNEIITLNFSENNLVCYGKNIIIKGKTIEGFYPDITNFFPKEANLALTLEKNELKKLLIKVVLSEYQLEGIRLIIDDKVRLETQKTNFGYATTETKNFQVNNPGQKLRINFNPRFLMDSLKNLDSEKVKLVFNGPQNPILIADENENERIYYRGIILPFKD